MSGTHRYIILALTLLFTIASHARITFLRDSLEQSLKEETHTANKISTLYNLYDLSLDHEDRMDALSRLYHVAESSNRAEVQLDAMSRMVYELRDNDSALSNIEHELSSFLETNRQREVMLYAAMMRTDIETRKDTGNDLSHLEDLFKRENLNTPTDPYDRALMLYTLCSRLAKTTNGELLEQYVQRLEDVLDQLPLSTGSIRNHVYSRAAPVFTVNQNYTKAVELDKKLINVIDSLSDAYHSHGRPFRDLSRLRFASYQRLLGNYKGLTKPEIEGVYNKINELAQKDTTIAKEMKAYERTDIFYFLATKQYRKAIDAIKRQINNPENESYRFYYLNALVEAAEKIGDTQTQLDAAVDLNVLLRKEIQRKTDQRLRELEIIYDVNTLKEANIAEMTAHKESRARSERIFAIGLLFAVVILAALLLILYRQNRKVKRMAELEASIAERLRDERNELQQAQQELIAARDNAKNADKLKTDFVNNMSHEIKIPLAAIVEYSKLIVDCVPEDKSSYLHRFANIIELNSKLITTLLNDVLDIAALEHGTMSIERKPSSIYEICTYAIDSLFEDSSHTSKGVQIEFNTEQTPDMVIDTDPQRVGQVLLNLLSNADKFTDKGRIDLEFKYLAETSQVEFSVSDTGIGIPQSQAENIFSRFRQLDNTVTGCGLGLYISRLLARLLGGELKLDTEHHGGSRFIFTIPVKG